MQWGIIEGFLHSEQLKSGKIISEIRFSENKFFEIPTGDKEKNEVLTCVPQFLNALNASDHFFKSTLDL